MNILWMSNAPHCNSGYGVVTAEVCKRLSKDHSISIFANYGLKGGMINWNGINVYPNDYDDWGNRFVREIYNEVKPDIIISLIDMWVLDNSVWKNMDWVPYFPLDHQEIPQLVLDHLNGFKNSITMSKFGKELADKNNIPNTYIPHGVDTKSYYPDKELRESTRKQLGVSDKFVVGTVAANVGERKNFELMLETFAEFHEHRPNSHYLIYTNPRNIKGIENMPALCKDLGIEDSVTFAPVNLLIRGAAKPEMNAIYNAMDVFLLLSKGEGFGIPIIEAQSCGVPVIVTNVTAMTELCGMGWLIDPERTEWSYQGGRRFIASKVKAVDALESAYRCANNKFIRNKAREFALDYDWDEIVKNYWLPFLFKIKDTYNKGENG